MRFRRILGVPAILFALLFLVAGSSRTYAQTTDSAHINQLFADAQHYAGLAARDGEELESFTRSNLHWESHAQQLEIIREHVNHLGEIVQQLNEARDQGSPWQQTAIDRINPLMHEMAMQLTATIDHLSQNKARVQMKPYQDYARATYEVTSRAARVISDYVKYGQSKSKADAIEQQLELTKTGASK